MTLLMLTGLMDARVIWQFGVMGGCFIYFMSCTRIAWQRMRACAVCGRFSCLDIEHCVIENVTSRPRVLAE